MPTTPLTIVLALLIGSPSSPAQPPAETAPRARPGFDEGTGRDLRNFPPHRLADLLHEKIELTIPDMNTPRFTAAATIRFRPLAGDLPQLTLHGADLNIREVRCPGHTATFILRTGEETFDLTFDPPIGKDETAEVRIDYEVNDPAEGIVWVPESPAWPGRAASLHAQGEPESNRYWFPTFDSPNERLTSEVIATVPEGFTVSSNGRLVDRWSMPGTGGVPLVTWAFSQEQEHAPYLITLAVGKWDIVDVADATARIPMPVYLQPGQADRARPVFGRTPRMVALYERLFDEPYPWAKYAQVMAINFAWGGMENTSATTLNLDTALDSTALLDGDADDLICHELAHQWFGDLMTCKSWEHIWLNEGWATYCEALWEQYRAAPLPTGREADDAGPTARLKADNDAYQYLIWKNFRDVIDKDHADAPFQPGMVSKVYTHPDEVFDREANPYPKGSAVLHMLRQRLTDPVFFRAVAAYIDRCRNTPVETFEFRTSLEEVSGLSLARFFDQWCIRPGVPHVTVTPEYSAGSRSLKFTVEQTQPINGANPAFFFDLPVWIDTGGTPRLETIKVQDRSTTAEFPLPQPPRRIVIDPDLSVLADIILVQDPDAFSQTLAAGPTLGARLQAIAHLGRNPGDHGLEALAAAVRDAKAHYGLRVEAAKALGHLANPGAEDEDDDDTTPPARPAAADQPPRPEALPVLTRLLSSDLSDARIRTAVISAIGIAAEHADRAQVRTIASDLMARYAKEKSYAARAETLRALGRMKAPDASRLFDDALRTDSHADQIRQGAIEGLRRADFPDSLERILPLAAPGRPPETRQAAATAAGRLAAHDRERVFNLLSAMVNDPEVRTRRAAFQALLRLDDPRARPVLDQWVAAARSRSDKAWGAGQLREHDASHAPASAASAVP